MSVIDGTRREEGKFLETIDPMRLPEHSGSREPNGVVGNGASSGPAETGELSANQVAISSVIAVLSEAARVSGGYVQMAANRSHLPFLLGSDGVPINLYEFVEGVDGALEYERLQKEFPTLSYSQIAGALSFLRKVAQINSKGIDIDDMIEKAERQDPEFADALTEALDDKDSMRVLDFDE